LSNRYLLPSGLPFEKHGAPTVFFKERSSADVVESGTAPGTGLHPHLSDRDEHVVDDGSDFAGTCDDDDRSSHDPHDANDNANDATGHYAGLDDRIDPASRQQLLQRDKIDREAGRVSAQRERDERRAVRNARAHARRRRRAPSRARHLDADLQRFDETNLELWLSHQSGDEPSRGRGRADLSAGDHLSNRRGVHVATHTHHLKSAAGPLRGSALAIYFVLLPFVVVTRWNRTSRLGDATFVRALLVVLALFWILFLLQVLRNVIRLRRGGDAGGSGSAWLAGLVVALMPFLMSSSASTLSHLHQPPPSVHATAPTSQRSALPVRHSPAPPTPGLPREPLSLGALPMALMAKRRSDLLRQHQFTELDGDVDETIELLRALNPALTTQLRQKIGDAIEGVLEVAPCDEQLSTASTTDPLVVCYLGAAGEHSLVGFAREGGRLAILPTWTSDDVRTAVVALHSGKIVFADTEQTLLRALATRSVRNTTVVYLGHGRDLDAELASCAITLRPYVNESRHVATSMWTNATAPDDRITSGDVRIDLLRADPQVLGLVEPLTPSLRRRGIEMLAYLALHRHEPITGDRLRTRVLTHADVDASLRTLANTASVVRRSVGADAAGQRLHAVTSSGLYVTHGITSDVEIFTTLIGRARNLGSDEAAALAHQALAMVKGEPLASALRGFEWFLAEGFGARLSRDGEWAALALHHDALANDRFELAFWALQQGLLIDPYSDVLLEALARVPRLREFGGDGAGATKHEPVGAGRAEAMSWSFNGFSNQITQ
jgi:hypothetical protein